MRRETEEERVFVFPPSDCDRMGKLGHVPVRRSVPVLDGAVPGAGGNLGGLVRVPLAAHEHLVVAPHGPHNLQVCSAKDKGRGAAMLHERQQGWRKRSTGRGQPLHRDHCPAHSKPGSPTCAIAMALTFVVFQSQTNSLPSPSPLITKRESQENAT